MSASWKHFFSHSETCSHLLFYGMSYILYGPLALRFPPSAINSFVMHSVHRFIFDSCFFLSFLSGADSKFLTFFSLGQPYKVLLLRQAPPIHMNPIVLYLSLFHAASQTHNEILVLLHVPIFHYQYLHTVYNFTLPFSFF